MRHDAELPAPPGRGDTASLTELAVRFNISRTLAYELAKRDRLPVPVICLGRRVVVSRAAMERVLAGERPAGAQPDDVPA